MQCLKEPIYRVSDSRSIDPHRVGHISNVFLISVRTGSASVTRLPGKGSKSVIPRVLIPAVEAQAACALPPSEVIVQDFVRHPDKAMSQAESNLGDQTPRGRASALPTLAGTRRGVTKSLVNQTGSSTTTKSKQSAISAPQKRQLEKEFTTKRQKYMTLKKELAEKQVIKLPDEAPRSN